MTVFLLNLCLHQQLRPWPLATARSGCRHFKRSLSDMSLVFTYRNTHPSAVSVSGASARQRQRKVWLSVKRQNRFLLNMSLSHDIRPCLMMVKNSGYPTNVGNTLKKNRLRRRKFRLRRRLGGGSGAAAGHEKTGSLRSPATPP